MPAAGECLAAFLDDVYDVTMPPCPPDLSTVCTRPWLLARESLFEADDQDPEVAGAGAGGGASCLR